MICNPCKEAGLAHAEGNTLLADELHRECTGNCDCQHQTDMDYINRERLRAEGGTV
jgi:hypothetical protein